MSKKVTQSNKTYQIRPSFKDKFRPAEAKEKIEKILREKLKNAQYQSNELPQWNRDIADQTKQELKNLGKDKRYKYLVQVIIGHNTGQGVRVGSRCFWDEDTDDCAYVTYMNDSIFCLVVAFAVYLY